MALKFSGFTTGATTANTLVVGYDSVLSTNNQYTLAEVGEGMFGTDFSKTNFSWEYSNTRLGIGTASPSAALQVNSNAGEEGLVVNGSQNQYVSSFRSDTTTGQAWGPYIRGGSNSSDAGLIVDKADGTTTYFKVRGDGNVGIGVTDPDSFLEVFGTTTQQKWSYDADSFITMTVADSSNTTIETGETGSLEMKVGGNLRLSAGDHIFQNAAGVPLADLETIRTQCFTIACSDETTALAAGTNKAIFRMPYAFTLKEVRASLTTAGTTSGLTTIDIHESGTTILSTKITIDLTETTSVTAAAQPVISDASLADDAQISIDLDAISGGASETGLKVTLIGYPTV